MQTREWIKTAPYGFGAVFATGWKTWGERPQDCKFEARKLPELARETAQDGFQP